MRQGSIFLGVLSRFVFGILTLTPATGRPAPARASPATQQPSSPNAQVFQRPKHIAVEAAHFFQRHPRYDPGEIHVFFRNTGTTSVLARAVYLDGAALPAEFLRASTSGNRPRVSTDRFRPSERIHWYFVRPNPLEPGEVAHAVIKLKGAARPNHTVRIDYSGGASLTLSIPRRMPDFHFTAVRFSTSLDKVFAYVRNAGDRPLQLRRVRLLGNEVRDGFFWIGHPVEPNDAGCLVVRLPQPLRKGQWVDVAAETAWGTRAMARVRALSHFAIGFERSGHQGEYPWRSGVLLPPEFLDQKPLPAGAGATDGGPVEQIQQLIACPMHCSTTPDHSALTIIDRYTRSLDANPQIPAATHVCRNRKEVAYFLFGPLADAMRMNPHVFSLYTPHAGPDFCRDEWLTGLAKAAAAPGPIYTIGDTNLEDRYLTLDQLRLLLAYQVSRGSKSIFYRLPKREEDKKKEEVARLRLAYASSELACLSDYLACAEVVPWAKTDRSKVEAVSLLYGDEGVILLLINHRRTDRLNPRFRDVRFETVRDITVTVNCKNLAVDDPIAIGSPPNPPSVTRHDTEMRLQVPELESCRYFLLPCKANSTKAMAGIRGRREKWAIWRSAIARAERIPGNEIDGPLNLPATPDFDRRLVAAILDDKKSALMLTHENVAIQRAACASIARRVHTEGIDLNRLWEAVLAKRDTKLTILFAETMFAIDDVNAHRYASELGRIALDGRVARDLRILAIESLGSTVHRGGRKYVEEVLARLTDRDLQSRCAAALGRSQDQPGR